MGPWWSRNLVVANTSNWISETGVKLPGAHVCELVSEDCMWRIYSRLMGFRKDWPLPESKVFLKVHPLKKEIESESQHEVADKDKI